MNHTRRFGFALGCIVLLVSLGGGCTSASGDGDPPASDAATMIDAALPPDLATPDLSPQLDLALPVDMATPPDLLPVPDLSPASSCADWSLDVAQVAFGKVAVGAPSPPAKVRLSKRGPDAGQLTSIIIGGTDPGDFILDLQNGLPNMIQGGASAIFSFHFGPRAQGPRSAVVRFGVEGCAILLPVNGQGG